MKIGAEDKKKVIVMAVLLVIAIPLAIRSFNFGGSDASAASNPPASTTSPTTAPSKKPGLKVHENTLDPTLHTEALIASQKVEYSGNSRNIFRMEEPKLDPLPHTDEGVRSHTPPAVPMEIQKPPIPLTYYGFSNRPGEPKKAFLKENDNIFVAVEGDVVDRRYKIVKITPNFILVEDILNNNQQTINLSLPQAG